MKAYSYQKEIRRCLIHFINAFDGAEIRREDSNGNVRQIIKANYQFGTKSLMYKDIETASDQVVLPMVTIVLNGLTRNNERSLNKNQEYQITNSKYKKNESVFIPTPTPVDLDISVTFTTSYYSDLLQLVNNFIPYSNPYIRVSMKEPWSDSEIISTITWDGSVTFNNIEEFTPTDKNPRHVAQASFKFETWIFKEKEKVVKNICFVEQDYYLEKQWRKYSDIILDEPEIVRVTGKPQIKYVQPFTTTVGRNENFVLIADDVSKIEGVFLSGNNPNMFSYLSSYDLFPNELSAINAVSIPFLKTDSNLIFEIPKPQTTGFFDIIISNSCTYEKLIGSNGFWTISNNNCQSTSYFTPYSGCCPTFMDNVFLSGIKVLQTYNSDCTLSPCNSTYTPPINIC